MNIDCNCLICDKEFQIGAWDIKYGRGKYCSKACKHQGQRTGKHLNCDACGKRYWVLNSRIELYDQHYCSVECRGVGLSEQSRTTKTCEACGNEYDVVNSQAPFSKTCSRKCDGIRKRTIYKGAGSPSWKGGLTDINMRLRGTIGYQEWRTAVFERDDYSCRCCGRPSKADIMAHHLNGFANFPDQRLDVDNGVTLCKRCHNGFHKMYRNGENTKEQYQEYFAIGNLESVAWA